MAAANTGIFRKQKEMSVKVAQMIQAGMRKLEETVNKDGDDEYCAEDEATEDRAYARCAR